MDAADTDNIYVLMDHGTYHSISEVRYMKSVLLMRHMSPAVVAGCFYHTTASRSHTY